MSKTTHTPTPWRAIDHMRAEDGTVLTKVGYHVCPYCHKKGSEAPVGIQIIGKDFGVAHCLSYDPAKEHAQHAANAEHIIRCVNEHAELIAQRDALAQALRGLSELVKSVDESLRWLNSAENKDPDSDACLTDIARAIDGDNDHDCAEVMLKAAADALAKVPS